MISEGEQPKILIVMGVSGVGKSTIGQMLADERGWPFLDADDFHPLSNKEKMRRGEPLTDDDRWAWLESMRDAILDIIDRGACAVLACSALRAVYRDVLKTHPDGRPIDAVCFVYLQASPEVVQRRLQERTGHFMNPVLLESQFATLEEPADALVVDAANPPELVVRHIFEQLAER